MKKILFVIQQKSQVDPILRHSKVIRDVLRTTNTGVSYNTHGSRSFFASWAPHIAQALACKKFNYPQISDMVMYDKFSFAKFMHFES